MIERVLAVLRGPSFSRGLAIGALVGAAIAGSTIWSRWRRPRAGSTAGSAERLVADGPRPARDR